MKEEARPDRPPKMVHHDRVRRYVQAEVTETPRCVSDAIASFSRRATATTQTTEGVEVTNNGEQMSGVSVQCITCQNSRINGHGMYRTFDYLQRCHLCYDSTSAAKQRPTSNVDDVTDHDLFFC